MGAGLELSGLRKDSTEFPVEISLSPLQSDHGMTVSAAIRDVTDRKQAEDLRAHAAQRESEASHRLRQVDRLRSDFLSTDLIFGRFYRAGGQNSRRQGTGIGLAIVKEFTEAQGGRVEVTSTLGQGTTFTLLLPAN